jgi:acetyltransferase-like isoleucine patch superfamily enzyme
MSRIGNLFRAARLLSHPQGVSCLIEAVRLHSVRSTVLSDCPELVLKGNSLFQSYQPNCLKVAGRVIIEHGCVFGFGESRNGVGEMEIGAGTWVGEYNNFRLTGGTKIVIGADCLISQFCSFISANHGVEISEPIKQQPNDLSRKDITIGDGVWIGAGAVILPGVQVGNGSVIGANSTVTKNVPSMEIWAGSPAVKIRAR